MSTPRPRPTRAAWRRAWVVAAAWTWTGQASQGMPRAQAIGARAGALASPGMRSGDAGGDDRGRRADGLPLHAPVDAHAPVDRHAYPRGGVEREGEADLR